MQFNLIVEPPAIAPITGVAWHPWQPLVATCSPGPHYPVVLHLLPLPAAKAHHTLPPLKDTTHYLQAGQDRLMQLQAIQPPSRLGTTGTAETPTIPPVRSRQRQEDKEQSPALRSLAWTRTQAEHDAAYRRRRRELILTRLHNSDPTRHSVSPERPHTAQQA